MSESSFIKSTHLSSPWIIDQLLLADQDHPYSIIGPAGVGKTFLLINWALCCASSTFWLGHRVLQQKILFVRPDRKMQDFQHRVMAWKALYPHAQGDVKETLYLLDISDYRKTPQTIYEEIVQLVYAHNISLIILDEWESLRISPFEMGQLLQERFHVTLLYSLSASANSFARTPHNFLIHSVREVAETGELAVTLTLPSTSPLAEVDLFMTRVKTPGMMVDSFRESCVVFQKRETSSEYSGGRKLDRSLR